METKGKYILICLSILMITGIVAGTTFSAATKKTIEGVVNDTYQIVTDDEEVYYIVDNEMGEQIMDYVGLRVKATCIVEHDKDTDNTIITIEKFSVIEKDCEFEKDSVIEDEIIVVDENQF